MSNWLNSLVDASPAARHVAYAGEVEFGGCTEDDRTGRTVTFLLRRQKEELDSSHPFSAHTRRRRGHAGTQFEASLQLIDGQGPIGMRSMMLLNWGASPKGETVKFLLTFEDEKHPFLVCQRAAKDAQPTRWMVVFAETDDQSQVVDQQQRAAIEGVHRNICVECNSRLRIEASGPHQGTLRGHLASCTAATSPPKLKQQIRNSNLAAMFIKNPRFHQFMRDIHGFHATDEHDADLALKALLGIDSKADLDAPAGGEMFKSLREEFVEWQLEAYGPEALD